MTLGVILLGMVLLSACALTTDSGASQPTSISLLPTATHITPTTGSSMPTIEFVPSDTPTPTPTAIPTDSPCTPRSDWASYAVQRGDTLAIIAERVGSTTNELVNANCLSDPDQIFVGQALYVPRLPSNNNSSGSANTSDFVPSTDLSQSHTNSTYGFSFNYPSTWSLSESNNRITLTRGSYALQIGFKREGENINILGSGLPAGEPIIVAEETSFMGLPIQLRRVLVTLNEQAKQMRFQYQGLDEIPAGNLRFVIVLDDTNPDYDAIDIPPAVQREVDRILATFSRQSATAPSGLTVNPSTLADGWYRLQPGETVNIRWGDAPANSAYIQIYLSPTGTGTNLGEALGRDNSPADGVQVSWRVANGFSGHLLGISYNGAGQEIARSELIQVYAE